MENATLLARKRQVQKVSNGQQARWQWTLVVCCKANISDPIHYAIFTVAI